MQFSQGRIGRVFLVKFEDGDVFIDEIVRLAKKKKIKTAVMVFLGGARRGHLVTGPQKPVVPPEPNWVEFKDGWEVTGIGSVFSGPTGPQVHLHAMMGKKKRMLTGCLRKDSSVFLVVEAVVFELKGINAVKEIDPKTGLNLLKILR